MLQQLFIGLIVVFASSLGMAEDYELRLEVRGHEVQSTAEITAEDALEDAILEVYETIIRESIPFRIRVQQGKRKISIDGEFSNNEKGLLSGTFKFRDALDTGALVPVAEGNMDPVENMTSVQTTVSLKPGEPLCIGGMEIKSNEIQSDGSARYHWKRSRLMLSVEKRAPEAPSQNHH